MDGAVLLFSGGLDSAAIAALTRPQFALFVDYGQRPAAGELAAATAIAARLSLVLRTLTVDCSNVGSGLLSSDGVGVISPSPEWWPFRNQLLVTLGAAWCLLQSCRTVVMGSVAGDAERHIDGSAGFYARIDAVTAMQEGGIRVRAPALSQTTSQLVAEAGLSDSILALTHSCHRSPVACGQCPGCEKRRETLNALGRLR
jgi:7-cyano-7-deazaguanine synthase